MLMNTLLHGVGSGFDKSDNRLFTHLIAQAFQRGRYCRRVMGEIVVNLHPTNVRQQFHTTLYTGEPAQRGYRMIRRYAHMPCRRDSCQRVANIMQAGMAPLHRGDRLFMCLLYTSPSPRDGLLSRMPSSA